MDQFWLPPYMWRCSILDDREGNEVPLDKVPVSLTLAYYSMLAYKPYEEIQDAKPCNKCNLPNIGDLNLKIVTEISSGATGTNGFIATDEDNKIAVVAFRGVSSKIDRLVFRLYRPVRFYVEFQGKVLRVSVHKGIYKSFYSVYPDFKEQLETLLNEGYSLYITGHGLGAGLSEMLSFHLALHRDNLKPLQVTRVGFGGPPVGDEGFSYVQKNSAVGSLSLTVIGDRGSYERCPFVRKMGRFPMRYKKAPVVYYLPHLGSSSLKKSYIDQLCAIENEEGHMAAYDSPLRTRVESCEL